jgi:hypothetical protein
MAGTIREEILRVIDIFGAIDKDLRKELRPVLMRVAQPVLERAKANAAWSSRIPQAMRISPGFSTRRAGVAIVVSARRAPHARPYENLGRQGTFRHPVFGHRDRWVSQPARPFLFSALSAADAELMRESARMVDEVARKHGFK